MANTRAPAAGATAAPAVDGTVPDSSPDSVVYLGDNGQAAPKVNLEDLVVDVHPPLRRTSTWMDTAYHSITGMVGAGVLGLPAALSALGWPGGIIVLFATFWISWYTYKLLVHMHEVPDLDAKGEWPYRRLDRYQDLTTYVFRSKVKGQWSLVPFQYAVLIGIAITYTVVGAQDMQAFVSRVAAPGVSAGPLWAYLVAFGALQVLLSMLPSFNELAMVSLFGAAMSIGYCTIATVMAGLEQPGPDVSYIPDRSSKSSTEYAFDVFNAVTTMLFAYGGHNVALEVQATLPSPPTTVPRMMRGVHAAFAVTGIFYLCVTVSGFHAFGVGVKDNVLFSLTKGPSWPVALATMLVVVHVAAAYQVYMQPLFENIDASIVKRTGRRMPVSLRVLLRTALVALLTFIAILIPFFGSLMGLIGAIGITPTTFLMPCLLWLLYKKPRRWGWEWCINWLLVIVTGGIGVLGTIGACWSIHQESQTYHVFTKG